ncbi:MAG TPA: ATP-binding protein, partial [Dehalococcoidia bacterium]|nr:ATP-binding protein [Dehalococcoidia bacterium]
LTLARADAGQIPIAREPVELAELVSAAIEQVRTTAELANIQISSEPGPAVVLQGDEDLLLQLLLNLLDNAIKYTPAHGRITAGWNVDGKVVRLWVRDTGIGISPEHQSRIFERFYAVDRARSRSKGGAGLGLSISLWIAEVQGGLISVESEPGQGSTFTVNLPL